MTTETSPCVKVCVLDPVSGFCIGCGRTIDEISGWVMMTRDQRVAVNAALPARLERMTSREARGGRRARG